MNKKRYQRPETACLCLNMENVMYSTSVPVGGGDGPGTGDARELFSCEEEEDGFFIED